MKKSIVYLTIALITFSTSFATNSTSTIHIESLEDTTPLCLAISKGEIELVKKFVEYGINVNQESNGITPLMMAARYNKVEIMIILIAKGAKIRTQDANGYTALAHAERSNAKEAVEFIKSQLQSK